MLYNLHNFGKTSTFYSVILKRIIMIANPNRNNAGLVQRIEPPVVDVVGNGNGANAGPPVKAGDDEYIPGTASIVYVTAPSIDVARAIAHEMVQEKLAACVNIIPDIESIYKWKGKINSDSEVMLMIKTETSRVDAVSQYVRENHPYDVPEVISVLIENGSQPYLKYLRSVLND